MRRLLPARIDPRLLPLVVIALIGPALFAFIVLGVQFGLALGALTIAGLVTVAARLRYDEPIEVAPRIDDRYRILVLAAAPLERSEDVDELARLARDGARAIRSRATPELLVLAPAFSSRLDRWATDLGPGRMAAQRSLTLSLAALAAAGLDARGEVGDERVVQAVEDTLAEFPAQELVFVPGERGGAAELGEIRRRLDRPVRELSGSKPAG